MIQNGTHQSHGRTWPLYQQEAFSVEVMGTINAQDFESAELLQRELHELLDRYGLKVRVVPVLVLFMLPEHQAEKEALDEAALAKR